MSNQEQAQILAQALMKTLIVASNAKTDEEKARVCWRASDHLWNDLFKSGLGFALPRAFNNLCQDQNWPWVKDLWSKAEIEQMKEPANRRQP